MTTPSRSVGKLPNPLSDRRGGLLKNGTQMSRKVMIITDLSRGVNLCSCQSNLPLTQKKPGQFLNRPGDHQTKIPKNKGRSTPFFVAGSLPAFHSTTLVVKDPKVRVRGRIQVSSLHRNEGAVISHLTKTTTMSSCIKAVNEQRRMSMNERFTRFAPFLIPPSGRIADF